MKRTRELFEDQEMEILAKRMFADGHAKLHRTIVHGAVDSDVCYMYEDNNDGGSDAVSIATRSNMLRQSHLRGKENIARSIECQIRRESKVATEASSMIVLYTVYRSVFTNFIFICHPFPHLILSKSNT